MLKLNQICKLNEDTMASYESQLKSDKRRIPNKQKHYKTQPLRGW